MTAMKKTSTKKAAVRRLSVKERARAIVTDANRYDEGTRHTISNLLREGSKDLAESVRRAEAGEEIFDLIPPLPNAQEEQRGPEESLFPEAGLTPEEAAAMVGSWDTNGAGYTEDLLLSVPRTRLQRPQARGSNPLRRRAGEGFDLAPVSAALDELVKGRLAKWRKEVPR
jgi:hypothetical protein